MRDVILAEPFRDPWRTGEDDPARLTSGDAARLLGVSAEMVRKYVRLHRLACTRTPRGQRLFRETEVQRLADERAYLALAPAPPPALHRRRGTANQLRLRLFQTKRKSG